MGEVVYLKDRRPYCEPDYVEVPGVANALKEPTDQMDALLDLMEQFIPGDPSWMTCAALLDMIAVLEEPENEYTRDHLVFQLSHGEKGAEVQLVACKEGHVGVELARLTVVPIDTSVFETIEDLQIELPHSVKNLVDNLFQSTPRKEFFKPANVMAVSLATRGLYYVNTVDNPGFFARVSLYGKTTAGHLHATLLFNTQLMPWLDEELKD